MTTVITILLVIAAYIAGWFSCHYFNGTKSGGGPGEEKSGGGPGEEKK